MEWYNQGYEFVLANWQVMFKWSAISLVTVFVIIIVFRSTNRRWRWQK